MTGRWCQWRLLIGLFALPLFVFVFSGLSGRFSTDLLDLAPTDSADGQGARAMRAANTVLARQVFVVIEGELDTERRQAMAAWLHEAVGRQTLFANVFIPGETSLPKPMLEVLQERKLSLLFPAWLERRRAEYVEDGTDEPWIQWLARRQARHLDSFLNSPYGDEYASQVTQDPLLLLPDAARTLGTESLPEVAPQSGPWVVWIGLAVNPLDGKEQDAIVDSVDQLRNELHDAFPAVRISTAGVYAVAQEASRAAEAEVTRLNAMTAVAVLALLVVFMRRVSSILTLLVPVAVAVLWALAGGLLVFERIHILALGMSAVLLGLAIDYGIHAEMHRLTSRHASSVWKAVRKPLLAGCLSSCFGFLIMLEAPILALRQVAVLVPSGLCGALLAVSLLYYHQNTEGKGKGTSLRFSLPAARPVWLIVFFIATSVWTLWMLVTQSTRYDAIEDFQAGEASAKAELMEVLQHDSQMRPGAQWVLFSEDAPGFYEAMGELQAGSDAVRIPFLEVIRPMEAETMDAEQRRAFSRAFQAELVDRDFDVSAFQAFWGELETIAPGSGFNDAVAALNAVLPGPLGLTFGYDNGVYFSAFTADAPDESLPLVRLAERDQLNVLLERASQSLMWQCLYGWPIVALVLVLIFRWRDGLRIGLLMLWAALCGAGLQLLVLGSFSLMGWIGLILACCLAIDYGAFSVVERGQPLPSVRLSMLTTLAAFSILGTSEIPALRALGLSVVFSVSMATLGIELLNARAAVACQKRESV